METFSLQRFVVSVATILLVSDCSCPLECLPDVQSPCQCGSGNIGTVVCNDTGSQILGCRCNTPDVDTWVPDASGPEVIVGPETGNTHQSDTLPDRPCPPCYDGSFCLNGECTADPKREWFIFFKSATIYPQACNNQPWDADGLPDPRVELVFNGLTYRTETVANTLSPTWYVNQSPAIPAESLLSGVEIRLINNSGGQLICSGPWRFTTKELWEGHATRQCDPCNGPFVALVSTMDVQLVVK